MDHTGRKLAAISLLAFWIAAGASCTSENKTTAEPSAQPSAASAQGSSAAQPESSGGAQGVSTIAVRPGEAGGAIEEKITVSASVAAIDPSTRKITLSAPDGSTASFLAGPEIRNFDQIRVGDRVTATVVQQLVVFVRTAQESPTVTHAAALASAPKGAKPGALVAETYEIVATVKSIDSAKHTATLQFADGQTKIVPVRSDVDLSRYGVGDNVVIRVSEALLVLVGSP